MIIPSNQTPEPGATLHTALDGDRPACSRAAAWTLRGLIGLVLVVLVAWFWRMAQDDPTVRFLPDDARAEWIVYPKTPEAKSHKVIEFPTTFRRTFALETVPGSARLAVRALTRCQVTINGTPVELPAPARANFKQVSQCDVSNQLRTGENLIVVTAFSAASPPALWLRLQAGGAGVVSDEHWEASYAGAAWRLARLATAPMKAGPGNPLYGGEDVLTSLRSRWPTLALFAVVSVGAVAGWRWWRRRAEGVASGVGRASLLARPLLLGAVVAWLVLFGNNLGSLPRTAGFDVNFHLDYIKYLQEHGGLPTAQDGPEMYNPPLFYGLCAGVLRVMSLSTNEEAASVVIRLITMGIGIVHLLLIFASLRLIFPGEVRKQILGFLLSAFLPVHLYLSHYVTNETLTALLVTGSLYLCLRVLRREQSSWRDFAAVGACLGAALLTKLSALLAVPFVLGAVAARVYADGRRDAAAWCRSVGVTILTCLLVCGWHYGRVWALFGSPLVGAWDDAAGLGWWQDEGYRTGSYFMRFGESLIRPFYSGMNGFADGVYSTLWGDGLYGGGGGVETRPPWNYDLMAAGFLLAILPSLGIAVGAVMACGRFLRRPSAQGFLLVGLPSSFLAALVYMTLRVPCYSQVKAFYGLLALLPLCAFGAEGLDFFAQRARWGRSALYSAIGLWLLTSYAAFWIPGRSVPAQLAAGRDLAADGRLEEAVNHFTTALEYDPGNAQARKRLARAYLQMGRVDEARALAEQVLKDNPDNADAHQTLALILAASGQTDQALLQMRRAIELGPEHRTAYRMLAEAMNNLGRADECIQLCREALTKTPLEPALHTLMEKAGEKKSDMEKTTGPPK